MAKTLLLKDRKSTQELQKQYQPIYDPNAEYRLARYKRGMSFDNYKVSTKGIIVGIYRKNTAMKWQAQRRNIKDTIPRVGLTSPQGNKVGCYVHLLVAFTFLDKMNWGALPPELLEGWDNYPDIVQDTLINHCFEVDHIDDNTWNPSIENLQFMLPIDNTRKSMLGNKYGTWRKEVK